jgi:hypothetical protein
MTIAFAISGQQLSALTDVRKWLLALLRQLFNESIFPDDQADDHGKNHIIVFIQDTF